jgi:hypothetical protein
MPNKLHRMALKYQMAIKYTYNNFLFQGLQKYVFPTWDFWHANIPSGNAGGK